MTDAELRRLKRPDLLELLVTQGKEKEALQERLRQAEEALASRRIQLDEAEAKAQALETETKARCQALDQATQNKCQELEAAAKAKCDQMVAQAEAETREFWDMVSQRLEKFYEEHAGLRELLTTDRLTGVIAAHADE